MMPVSKPEAQALSEIHALRGLTDAVATLTRQTERMNAKMDDVRERVIKLEAREYERQIETLNLRLEAYETRVNDLEGTRDQQMGAKSLLDWLRHFAPWILAFGAGFGIKAAGVGS
jgi:predicted RNase H-like nuclease (RuvC/YqgF family)